MSEPKQVVGCVQIVWRHVENGCPGNSWSWLISLSISVKPFRNDARIQSHWTYATKRSARIAAERWARRCGVTLIEPGGGS